LRLRGIALTVFIVAVGGAIAVGSPRYVFVVTALFVFGFLAIGFLLLPRLSCTLPFSLPPAESSERERTISVDAIEVTAAEFANRFACVFVFKGWDRLGRWLLVSVICFYVLLSKTPYTEAIINEHPFLSTYTAFLVGGWVITLAIMWYLEQSFLAHAAVTWGTAIGRYRYCFTGKEGQFYGGNTAQNVPSDPVFVLFNPRNPDQSIAVTDLRFRSFALMRRS